MASKLIYERLGLLNFLTDYSGMRLIPGKGPGFTVQGDFQFAAKANVHGEIRDEFRVQIEVPEAFPKAIPKVFEIAGRIPRIKDYHVNPGGSLCLGSRLRLLKLLAETPSLVGYAVNCLEPYLYAVAYKLENGGSFIFGELAHGASGELADYMNILGLDSPSQVREAFQLLAMKKRIANKLPCPCGCRKQLGRCRFNAKLRELRTLAPRRWFRENAP